MKTKIMKIAAILLMLAGIVSCGKDDKSCSCEEGGSNEPISLESTRWELAGIMDVKTCALRELEPKDCDDCYYLYFNTDSTAQGKSVMNLIFVSLTPKIMFGVMTEVYDSEIGDVQLFYDAMKTITSCAVTENELKFCCNGGKSYLLYKKEEIVYYN